MPATVAGTEDGPNLTVLRFRFDGRNDRLREVGWQEWLAAFDRRGLTFVHQELPANGPLSNLFRLESLADRRAKAPV